MEKETQQKHSRRLRVVKDEEAKKKSVGTDAGGEGGTSGNWGGGATQDSSESNVAPTSAEPGLVDPRDLSPTNESPLQKGGPLFPQRRAK